MQFAGECLLLRVRTVDVGTEYPESLLDGTFYAVGKALPCAGILSGDFLFRKFLRPIEKLFEDVGGKLLAQTGTVIYLTVLVVDEGYAVDATFLVFPEHHIDTLFPENPDEVFPVSYAAVHGQRDGVMDFGLPLPVPEITDVAGNPFFYTFVAEALIDERRLDRRTYQLACIVRQGIYDTVVG